MCSPQGVAAAEKWLLGTEMSLRHFGRVTGVGGTCELGVRARRALGAGSGGGAWGGGGAGARARGRLDNGDDASGRHERGGPAGSGHRAREALQRLALAPQRVELQAHGGVLPRQLVHLALQLRLLLLQLLLLAHALHAAAGSVTSVLQRAAPLLEPRHLLGREPTQVSVQLTYGQPHQRLVRQVRCVLAHLALNLRAARWVHGETEAQGCITARGSVALGLVHSRC